MKGFWSEMESFPGFRGAQGGIQVSWPPKGAPPISELDSLGGRRLRPIVGRHAEREAQHAVAQGALGVLNASRLLRAEGLAYGFQRMGIRPQLSFKGGFQFRRRLEGPFKGGVMSQEEQKFR